MLHNILSEINVAKFCMFVLYIGHADVTMGCVATNSQDLYKKMQENQICKSRSQKLVKMCCWLN